MACALRKSTKARELSLPSARLIVGLVCTGDDADAATFPLNRPVPLTDLLTASGKVGESGTLARSLDAIADQPKPVTVVVRVPQGESLSVEVVAERFL